MQFANLACTHSTTDLGTSKSLGQRAREELEALANLDERCRKKTECINQGFRIASRLHSSVVLSDESENEKGNNENKSTELAMHVLRVSLVLFGGIGGDLAPFYRPKFLTTLFLVIDSILSIFSLYLLSEI